MTSPVVLPSLSAAMDGGFTAIRASGRSSPRSWDPTDDRQHDTVYASDAPRTTPERRTR